MSNTRWRKDLFLGMPFGTASTRLRRNVRHRLVVLYDRDSCYGCGDRISDPEELSLEHKKPWLNRPNGVQLFWDLDNIAFSHRHCNRREPSGNGRVAGEAKSVFLGMALGTAMHRLWRQVLYDMLASHNDHWCYACGDEIQVALDLSLEHKKPWENRDGGVALFWDLGNVAFSHKRCNTPHNKRRKLGDEGTSWCYKCQNFLPDANFTIDQSRWNQRDAHCRDCKSQKAIRYAPRRKLLRLNLVSALAMR